ncbi:MAG: hypothetical protein R3324_11635, partial [Halobacteriales archaeon]|nr:hypothetical protein [Halobacteriales archaeon]
MAQTQRIHRAEPRRGRYVGRDVHRVDGANKVDGTVDYVDDYEFDGLVAHLVRSTVPHGTISDIDTTAAESLPGVRAVVTGQDLEAADWISPYTGPAFRDMPLLAVEKTRYVGEPVVAIVAEAKPIAEAAAERVQIEYERLPYASTPAEALASDAPEIHTPGEVAAVFDDLETISGGTKPNVAYEYTFDAG